MTPLKPPDLSRCQCEEQGGSFMTLGPRPWVRCEKPPLTVVRERKPNTDGQRGAMSLCEEHRSVMAAKPEFAGKVEYIPLDVWRHARTASVPVRVVHLKLLARAAAVAATRDHFTPADLRVLRALIGRAKRLAGEEP